MPDEEVRRREITLDEECPCGELATTTVEVQWSDCKRRYRYCEDCAVGVAFAIEGAEVVP